MAKGKQNISKCKQNRLWLWFMVKVMVYFFVYIF